jgi:hypothetical protein
MMWLRGINKSVKVSLNFITRSTHVECNSITTISFYRVGEITQMYFKPHSCTFVQLVLCVYTAG